MLHTTRRYSRWASSSVRHAARSGGWRPVEGLEQRTLMSITSVTGVADPAIQGILPLGLTYDGAGTLWVADQEGQLFKRTSESTLAPVVYGDGMDLHLMDNLVAGPQGLNGSGSFLAFTDLGQIDGASSNIIWTVDAEDRTVITGFEINLLAQSPLDTDIAFTEDGAIWFSQSYSGLGPGQFLNAIGRLGPVINGDRSLSYVEIPASGLANAISIATMETADGYGAYVALRAGADDGSSIGVVTMNGGTLSVAIYEPEGIVGQIGSVATDPVDQSVWFTVEPTSANSAPSQLVHGVIGAGGFESLVPYEIGVGMGLDQLGFDHGGDLWFVAASASQVGMLDTKLPGVTGLSIAPLPEFPGPGGGPTEVPFLLAINPQHAIDGTLPVASVGALVGFAVLDAFATVTPYPQPVYTGEAFMAFDPTEETTYTTAFPIASFEAPAGNDAYEAVVNWGDGSPLQVIAVGPADANGVHMVYASGKRWAQHAASLTLTVQIRLVGETLEKLTLTAEYSVLDKGLTVAAPTVTTLLPRLALLTTSFTDEADALTSWFTAKIEWAPGVYTTGIIVKDPFVAGRFFVVGLYQYKKKGTYTVKVTVTTTEAGAAASSVTASSLVTIR